MLVYDAGALIEADRRNTAMWALHQEAVTREVFPVVPTVVLAQAWRGGPAHNLSRLLKGCDVVPDVSASIARAAGELCAKAGTSDVVDALVVLLAHDRSAGMIVTSDPGDLALLTDVLGARLTLHAV